MGTTVEVTKLPMCQMGPGPLGTGPTCGHRAEYDFRTVYGPWAYGCAKHWQQYRAATRLGTGNGQQLILTTRIEGNEDWRPPKPSRGIVG